MLNMLRWIKSNPLLLPLRDNMAHRNQVAQQLDQESTVGSTSDVQVVKDGDIESNDIIAKCDTIIAKIKIKRAKNE
jgi:hypothetical protein